MILDFDPTLVLKDYRSDDNDDLSTMLVVSMPSSHATIFWVIYCLKLTIILPQIKYYTRNSSIGFILQIIFP